MMLQFEKTTFGSQSRKGIPMLTNEINPTVSESYDYYRHLKETSSEIEIVASVRKALLLQLVKECRNVLDNSIFLSLLEEEQTFLEAGNYSNNHISKINAISRTLRMHTGKEVFNRNEIDGIFDLECEGENFRRDTTKWLIELLIGNDAKCEAKERIVTFISRGRSTIPLEGIDTAFYENNGEFEKFNLRMVQITENPKEVRYNRRYQRAVVTNCICLFLMNRSLGDELTSNYFLMKALLLNFEEYDNYLLLLLLENVFILNTNI